MKIAIARLYTKNNNIEYNYNKIQELYNKAVNNNIDIIIFPRLALSGFCIDDNFLNDNFLKDTLNYFEKILDLTINKKTKIIIGNLLYEKNYQENNNIYKTILRDSIFFIDDGYIDTISSRKEINKSNIFNDYKYFDKDNILKRIEYNKKKFSILISDDIFSNFNIFLISDSKPDYILCFDSSIKDLEFRKKHLIKLAKFANSPVFYINNAGIFENNYFKGEIILINEDFEIIYNDIYKDDELFEFDIDYEDGTELFIKNKDTINKNFDISYLLEKINKNINIDNFSNEDIKNILNNKHLKLFSFDKKNIYNVNYINIEKYININVYNNLNKDLKNKINNSIVDLIE